MRVPWWEPGFGGGDAYGASGTSFYTTTEKQDSYDSLDKVLNAKCKDEGVRKVIVEMLDACGEITEALRSALVTVEGLSLRAFDVCDGPAAPATMSPGRERAPAIRIGSDATAI